MQFTPGLDIGFGENLTTYAGNFDFRVIRLRLPESGVALYGAVGPTLFVTDPDAHGSQTEAGLTVAAGMQIPMGRTGHYVLEVRFGFGRIGKNAGRFNHHIYIHFFPRKFSWIFFRKNWDFL